MLSPLFQHSNFNPQGPRGPRLRICIQKSISWQISIHKALAGLDYDRNDGILHPDISIHKALAGLDATYMPTLCLPAISIHKALAGLDAPVPGSSQGPGYFNPQGPRGPRPGPPADLLIWPYFNPQGPRGPRRLCRLQHIPLMQISIHKALAGLDLLYRVLPKYGVNFNPQGPRAPRPTR